MKSRPKSAKRLEPEPDLAARTSRSRAAVGNTAAAPSGRAAGPVGGSDESLWVHLCDLEEAKAARAAFMSAADDLANGIRVGFAMTLIDKVAVPARLCARQMEAGRGPTTGSRCAGRLADVASEKSALFDVGRGTRPTHSDADELYAVWLEFIAATGGPYLYSIEPKRRRQSKDAASRLRSHGKELPVASVATYMQERGLTKLSKVDVIELMARAKCSRATVYKRLRAARKAKLVA